VVLAPRPIAQHRSQDMGMRGRPQKQRDMVGKPEKALQFPHGTHSGPWGWLPFLCVVLSAVYGRTDDDGWLTASY
jgi:hypothetical protein